MSKLRPGGRQAFLSGFVFDIVCVWRSAFVVLWCVWRQACFSLVCVPPGFFLSLVFGYYFHVFFFDMLYLF